MPCPTFGIMAVKTCHLWTSSFGDFDENIDGENAKFVGNADSFSFLVWLTGR